MNIDRGSNGRNPRIRSLDAESHSDFVRGFRNWTFGDLDNVAKKRAGELLASAAVNDEDPSVETMRELFEPDPLIATRLRCWITSQRLMWKGMIDHYERHRDSYLADLAATDKAGPGRLELHPELDIPAYARHEIHIQPGGYVGYEFSGPLYHLGTNSFYSGHNDADQIHIGFAQAVTVPDDGRVERIVDLGCGVGQLTVALKERFPAADVWGLDVGGPLLRYAHNRAVKLGVDVVFAQRLAEASGMESGSVDIVAAYILFHEVPHEIAKAICAEAFRILRPGGIFNVVDFRTGGTRKPAPYSKFMRWADYFYNCEPWSLEFVGSDMLQMMRDAGFDTELGPDQSGPIVTYVARKPSTA